MSSSVAANRLTALLLAIAVVALGAAGIAGWGWHRAAGHGIEELDEGERQKLLAEVLAASPGVHQPAWFEPAIGYTLKPSSRLSAWSDTFDSNELGYRAAPAAKAPGIFRILFVGDSWTFGMGIRRRETYPAVVEELAAAHAGGDRKIEAWTLALPGYSTVNELAALWYFYPLLEPDAVVLAVSRNDHHSSAGVLPNGSLYRPRVERDELGDPHTVRYPTPVVDSHRFRQRWYGVFARIRDTERRLQAMEVPLLVVFIARWHGPLAHHLMARSGVEAPYLVVPIRLTLGEWLNESGDSHGNPAANRLYGRIVYRGLAPLLGWRELPADATADAEIGDVVLRTEPPAVIPVEGYLARGTARLPEEFRPGRGAHQQVAGPLEAVSGRMGRATTVLVRRRAGAARLAVEVERLPAAAGLYPLELTVEIPSPGGGTSAATTLDASGPALQRLELPLPDDIAAGRALDIRLIADRVATGAEPSRGFSLVLRSIEQLDSP